MTAKQQTLREHFQANSYQIKVDRYPFTDDYETVLGIQEALMSVKGWLLTKRPENFDAKTCTYYKGTQVDLNELLEELKDVFLPKRALKETKKSEAIS